MLAAYEGHAEVVQLLLHQPNIEYDAEANVSAQFIICWIAMASFMCFYIE
jgi:hypothetical protein